MPEQAVDWLIDGSKVLCSSSFEEVTHELANGFYVHQFSTKVHGLDQRVFGFGIASSKTVAKARSLSELYERVFATALRDQVETASAGTDCKTWIQWIEAASLQQLICLSNSFDTTIGFAAHIDHERSLECSKNEWLEHANKCKGSIPSGSKATQALIRDCFHGFYSRVMNRDCGAIGHAFARKESEAVEKAWQEAQLSVFVRNRKRIVPLPAPEDTEFEGETDAVQIPVPRFETIKIHTLPYGLRFVTFPTLPQELRCLVVRKIEEYTDRSILKIYEKRNHKESQENSPRVFFSAPEVASAHTSIENSGQRIFVFGAQRLLPISREIVANNHVFLKSPDAFSRSVKSDYATSADVTLTRFSACSLPCEVRSFLSREESRTKLQGFWFDPAQVLKNGTQSIFESSSSFYEGSIETEHDFCIAARCRESGRWVGAGYISLTLGFPLVRFVCVDADFRSSSIGTRILQSDHLTELGAQYGLFAYVSIFNSKSARMLEKAGFQNIGLDCYVT